MIKGINHTIIEINETGSEYYERAILIVKPEYASVQRALLEDEAKKMLRKLDVPSAMRCKRSLRKKVLAGITIFMGGILLGILPFLI